MQYARYEYIKKDSSEFPDATPFVVYKQSNGTWAFAMRFRNQFTLTRFQDQNVDADGVRKVKNQILFCKHYGWSYRGGKSMNPEVDEMEMEFECMYCGKTTFKTSQPCSCRNRTTESFMKKTKSGFILPF